MTMVYWAKPDQTYKEHLDAVHVAWKETIKAVEPFIDRIAKKYGFSRERFLKASLLTVVFHDIGKMITPFQEMMLAVKNKKYFNIGTNYRHELVSLVFIAKYWQYINKDEYLHSIPLEALAVVGHHRALNSDMTSFTRESNLPFPNILLDGIKEAILIAKEFFLEEGYTFPTIRSDIDCEDTPYELLAGLVASGLLNKGLEKDGTEKTRTLYFLLKGILHYADWHGSGKVDVRYSLDNDATSIPIELKQRCHAKGITYEGLRPFQKTCRDHSGHLIAIAPTGSGKTEASILWALNNIREMNGAKIIYLLPTMVTANSIWKRLIELFGEENVGLTHSTASLLLHDGDSVQDEEDIWENRRDILFSQSFIKPVTVATVDQLLTAGFNAGRWTLKEINASNAVVIMDEIHAYDDWALGLIISTIRHLSSLGTRFMLMSATLPSFLQNLLKKELNVKTIVKEESLLNAKRSKYFIQESVIDKNLENIEKAVNNGERVLVVVNTVGLCQVLSQKLSKLKPICYHSQFILKDRKAIENKISNANFVIATQVVEVSLDIDYDLLFTECAPPDAIAQRAGRVNRYRDQNRDSRVYIFKASRKGEKIYNSIDDSNLLSRSFRAFKNSPQEMSEADLISVVEKVYKNYNIEASKSFNDAIDQYRLSQTNRSMIFDSRFGEDNQEVTRQTKYEVVSVIPRCFKDQVLQMKPLERQWYEVKLPMWYVLRNKEEVKGITFCDVNYDPKIGVVFKKDKSVSSMII